MFIRVQAHNVKLMFVNNRYLLHKAIAKNANRGQLEFQPKKGD